MSALGPSPHAVWIRCRLGNGARQAKAPARHALPSLPPHRRDHRPPCPRHRHERAPPPVPARINDVAAAPWCSPPFANGGAMDEAAAATRSWSCGGNCNGGSLSISA
ncbi:Os03g0792350 [Oryza sativa Japonica Group]|uniref:Os03g0792350 protein n=1 Tax=Oryza sativa subsp. japonica TaxID=39947 RepID=A0A0N7KI70_ORYSJ|nr:Os03g0792350 [Oryza sativa Japonica Group]